MKTRLDFLRTIPENKRRHGWVTALVNLGYSFEEIEEYLEKEKAQSVSPKVLKALKEKERAGLAELAKEIDPEWQKDCRRRYIKGQIAELEALQKRAKVSNVPFWLFKIFWDRMKGDKWMRLEALMRNGNWKRGKGITEEMIEQARSVDITTLIETKSENWAICPFHPDKNPSLYLKNNFYHCFSCSETGSTIDLVMKRDGLGFIQAVKQLAGGG